MHDRHLGLSRLPAAPPHRPRAVPRAELVRSHAEASVRSPRRAYSPRPSLPRIPGTRPRRTALVHDARAVARIGPQAASRARCSGACAGTTRSTGWRGRRWRRRRWEPHRGACEYLRASVPQMNSCHTGPRRSEADARDAMRDGQMRAGRCAMARGRVRGRGAVGCRSVCVWRGVGRPLRDGVRGFVRVCIPFWREEARVDARAMRRGRIGRTHLMQSRRAQIAIPAIDIERIEAV